MTIEDQIREIMLSEELPDSEKLDRLHALIPGDVLEIDNLNKATPDQLKRLIEAMAVSEAIQQIRRRTTRQKNRAKPDSSSYRSPDVAYGNRVCGLPPKDPPKDRHRRHDHCGQD